MSISMDGNDLIWDGQVRITNFTNSETGVVTLVLTPAGGVGALPVLAQGAPGLPPIIDSVSVVEVTPGDPLPAPEWVLVTPGSAGVASHYTLKLYLHSGAEGAPGTNATIQGASDIVGTKTDGYILQYESATGKMRWVATRIGGLYVSTSIANTSGNSGSRVLASVTVPSHTFDWRPLVFAQTIVSGTANTIVDLVCRVSVAADGDQCGRAFGIAGATPPPLTLIPAFGDVVSSSYAKVTAGSAATIYLLAEQQATGVTDSWTTAGAKTTFTVKVDPVKT